jgi:hypothetical protein
MAKRAGLVEVLALSLACSSGEAARAAENATGVYLLGAKTSMAGFLPPPGTYATDYNYYYSGTATGAAAAGVALRRVGKVNIDADVKVNGSAFVDLPTVIWVAPEKVLGGHIGLGAIVPNGWKKVGVDIDALATLKLPPPLNITLQRGRHFELDDSTTAFGDPIAMAVLGWQHSNWYWNLQALLNVPVGEWQTDSISNIGFHRWALDITPAATWLDPKTGLEVSAAAGFTFNGENPDTDYRTGTEFHVEWALMAHPSKTLAFGIAGYHYQQITGDSGAGARLGGFEGRVTALGPDLAYTFVCGKIPVSTELKFFHELDVENRTRGNSGLLTVSMPLSLGAH